MLYNRPANSVAVHTSFPVEFPKGAPRVILTQDAGDITVITAAGDQVTLTCAAGEEVPVLVAQIVAAGTTVTSVRSYIFQ